MPAFRSAVNSGVTSSVDGTRGSVQGKANPHKTASQAIAAHVVQRHPVLGPTARPLSSLQILTCSLFFLLLALPDLHGQATLSHVLQWCILLMAKPPDS